jgi:hypothetical protein
MKHSKVPLIFIASNGQSGSTLLDMLLGCHPHIWTLGEFQMLPWEIVSPRRPCGCGEPILECPFWHDIVHIHKDRILNSSIHLFRQSRNNQRNGKVFRLNEIVRMRRKSDTNSVKPNIMRYGKDNAGIMKMVLDKSSDFKEVQYLVDASKDPYRLFWLIMSGYFDIYAIHLLKDPRAFLFSTTRNSLNSLSKIIRMNTRYILENQIISKTLSHLPSNHRIVVQYERLASNPDETMENIFTQFDISKNDYTISSFRETNHAISGNKMRDNSTNIKLDEKWKSKLPFFSKIITSILCYFPAQKYGYNL